MAATFEQRHGVEKDPVGATANGEVFVAEQDRVGLVCHVRLIFLMVEVKGFDWSSTNSQRTVLVAASTRAAP